MSLPDPISLAVSGVQQLVGSRMNKVSEGATAQSEGPTGDELDELTLNLSDEELLAIAKDTENAYKGYETVIKQKQVRNKTYYMGRQKDGTPNDTKDFPIAGNLIFEAEETFLPAALAKNPEPVVYADNTPEGNALSDDVKTLLQYHADVLVLRAKLALMVRHWSIYHLAVIKHGWDSEMKEIKSEVRDIRNFIFSPTASVDVYGDMDGIVGERITVSARTLADMFPDKEQYISDSVDGKMGTSVTYTEWWNDDYCFYTFLNKVLDKHRNEFFVYPKKEKEDVVQQVVNEGKNHFAKPKKPYTFLSVFSLGEQPHDITGLIEQNIPNQNLVTRRTLDVDRNLRRSNNSIGLSASNFNQQTGKQAANALESGDPVLIPVGPDGRVDGAIARFPAPAVPDSFFKDLENNKEALRSSFGTQGITAQTPNEDATARGMILSQQFDNSRIGGGIGDKLAQIADNVFNWWVQMYYVFYDEPHYAAILGRMKGTEVVLLSNEKLNKKLVISVSPDSMKPKDEVTVMNQAMSLFEQRAIDIKSLLTVLNFPNAEETAGQAWLYNTNPQLYGQMNFPELSQQIQQFMAQQQAQQQQPQPGAPPGGGQVAPQGAPTLGTEPANASLSNVPIQ